MLLIKSDKETVKILTSDTLFPEEQVSQVREGSSGTLRPKLDASETAKIFAQRFEISIKIIVVEPQNQAAILYYVGVHVEG